MVQKTIEIGEWAPDLYSTKEGIMTDVRNLIPGADGYKGAKRFVPVTSPVLDMSEDCYPRNAATFILPDREIITIVGTDKNLYIRGSGDFGDWINVSKESDAYNVSDSGWKFALFGDLLIATNYYDPVQCMVFGKDTKFSDLSESAPRARDLAVVGEFLVLVGTKDVYDDERPNRIWWSPIGDPRGEWVPNQTTMCDYQDIFTGSYITGIVGGEDALILSYDSLVRMTFVGSPVVFQFQAVSNDIGNVGFSSYTEHEGSVYFLSKEGFKKYTNGTLEPIGLGKVDNFYYSDALGGVFANTKACSDVKNSCIWFAYTDKNSKTEGDLHKTTKALVYHYPSKRWGCVVDTILAFSDVSTSGYSLDELDVVSKELDKLPYSLDSEAWRGGLPMLSAFSEDGRFGYFYGDFYTAGLVTGKTPLQSGARRSFVKRIRPLVDSGPYEATVAVAGMQEEQEEPKYTGYMKKTRVGDFPFRITGRYHTIKMKISGVWNKVVGFLIDYDDAGEF